MANCARSISREDCKSCHGYKGFCEYVDKKEHRQWLKRLRQVNKKKLGTDLPATYSNSTVSII